MADRKQAFDAIGSVYPGIWNVAGNVAALDAIIDRWEAGQVKAPPLDLEGALKQFGYVGPLGKSALIELFRNTNAPAATDGKIAEIASRLGATERQVRAVAKVESAGSGWDRHGLLACLWERHWMWKRVKIAVPFLSDPKPGGYTIDADGDGINDSWQKLADAAIRWGPIAFECASFGRFQCMGGHWKHLGYDSVLDLVWRLSRHENEHYEVFARFIEKNGLAPALRKVDGNPENARALAKGYNGAGYAKGRYHEKIAAAWKVA